MAGLLSLLMLDGNVPVIVKPPLLTPVMFVLQLKIPLADTCEG